MTARSREDGINIHNTLAELIGNSAQIVAARKLIGHLAQSSASVLVTGPSGSGKEVVAQLLHQRSNRAVQPFVAVNCGAIPNELLESELFGHEAGAFTGAKYLKRGKFETAHRGTIFLDEIGDMPSEMQVKLLRILDTHVVERVGGEVGISIDVRVVAATNVDLEQAIAHGRFREDLFYRLNVVEIRLAPLCERRDDIPPLLRHFTQRVPDEARRVSFTTAATAWLVEQPWRGNVRELRNFVERATALHVGEEIDCGLAQTLLTPARKSMGAWIAQPSTRVIAEPVRAVPTTWSGGPINLRMLLDQFEQSHIEQALSRSDGGIAQSARLLGLRRTTLIEKMRRLRIERPCGESAIQGPSATF